MPNIICHIHRNPLVVTQDTSIIITLNSERSDDCMILQRCVVFFMSHSSPFQN